MSFTASDTMKKWSYTEISFYILYFILGFLFLLLFKSIMPVELTINFVKTNLNTLLILLFVFATIISLTSNLNSKELLIVSIPLSALSLYFFNIGLIGTSLAVFYLSMILVPYFSKNSQGFWDFYSKVKNYNFVLSILITLIFAFFIRDAYLMYTYKIIEEKGLPMVQNYVQQALEYQKNYAIQLFKTSYAIGYLDAIRDYKIIDPNINQKLQSNLDERVKEFEKTLESNMKEISVESNVKAFIEDLINRYSIYVYFFIVSTFYGILLFILNTIVTPVSSLIWKLVKFKR